MALIVDPPAEERSELVSGPPSVGSARRAPRPAGPRLLAIDPSLRATGWLVVDVISRGLVSCGCVETSPGVAKGERALVRQHDGARSGAALFEAMRHVVGGMWADAVAVECPLGAQSADAAWAMGRGHQAVWCALRLAAPHLRPISVSAFAAKMYATGSKSPDGGKAEVQRAVRSLWGPRAWDALFGAALITTQRQREAVYDAAAVALCALEQPAVRVLVEDHRRASAMEGP